MHYMCRADHRLGPSQWETSLQSNAVSHWLAANIASALYVQTSNLPAVSPSRLSRDYNDMMIHGCAINVPVSTACSCLLCIAVAGWRRVTALMIRKMRFMDGRQPSKNMRYIFISSTLQQCQSSAGPCYKHSDITGKNANNVDMIISNYDSFQAKS